MLSRKKVGEHGHLANDQRLGHFLFLARQPLPRTAAVLAGALQFQKILAVHRYQAS